MSEFIQQVNALLRLGFSNEQIADRFGLTLDGFYKRLQREGVKIAVTERRLVPRKTQTAVRS